MQLERERASEMNGDLNWKNGEMLGSCFLHVLSLCSFGKVSGNVALLTELVQLLNSQQVSFGLVDKISKRHVVFVPCDCQVHQTGVAVPVPGERITGDEVLYCRDPRGPSCHCLCFRSCCCLRVSPPTGFMECSGLWICESEEGVCDGTHCWCVCFLSVCFSVVEMHSHLHIFLALRWISLIAFFFSWSNHTVHCELLILFSSLFIFVLFSLLFRVNVSCRIAL